MASDLFYLNKIIKTTHAPDPGSEDSIRQASLPVLILGTFLLERDELNRAKEVLQRARDIFGRVDSPERERLDATINDIAALVGGGKGKELLENGDMENGILASGQVMGLIRDIPTVNELIDTIVRDARAAIACSVHAAQIAKKAPLTNR